MAEFSSLQRQRRFLIVISLIVIAYYWLNAVISNTATFSGVGVSLNKSERIVIGLWVIWFWALLRYCQRIYELLSEVWEELLEDVSAEDLRIAHRRAKKLARQLAKLGKLTEDDPSKHNVTVDGPVNISRVVKPTLNSQKTNQSVHAFVPTKSGGRKYENIGATIRWVGEKGAGISTTSFEMEMTHWQVRWLRFRAWAYAILLLPAFTEHIAPLCLALVTPFSIFFRD